MVEPRATAPRTEVAAAASVPHTWAAAMVIPMVGFGSLESLPENVRSTLSKAKYPVYGLWVFGLLQFFLVNPVQAMSAIVLALFGTFLLNEDPQMVSCYRFLRDRVMGERVARTCCGNGGLPMLMPFFILSFSNAIVDFFTLARVVTVLGNQLKQPTNALVFGILLGVWLSETASAALTFGALKAVLAEQGGASLGYQALPGGPASAGPVLGGRGPVAPPGGGRQAGPDFVPFAGEGHRLGG